MPGRKGCIRGPTKARIAREPIFFSGNRTKTGILEVDMLNLSLDGHTAERDVLFAGLVHFMAHLVLVTSSRNIPGNWNIHFGQLAVRSFADIRRNPKSEALAWMA